MKKIHDLFINALLKLRDKLARAVLALIRPILEDTFDKLNRMQQDNLSTAFMHQKVFPQYKNIYTGKDVAIIACGPSINKYKPIEGVINIGVNRAYLRNDIKLDYLFMIDAGWVKPEEFVTIAEYRKGSCEKFFGLTNERQDGNYWNVMEPFAHAANAHRFRADPMEWLNIYNPKFSYDLSTQPLADCGSVVFCALQFAFWTNPRKIYLVGCDSTTSGHFYEGKSDQIVNPKLKDGYERLKVFAKQYYPNTEIISVNPVGLKGLFEDVYQGGL